MYTIQERKNCFTNVLPPSNEESVAAAPKGSLGPSNEKLTRNISVQVDPVPAVDVRERVLLAMAEENERLKKAYYEQLLKQEEELLKIRVCYERKRKENTDQCVKPLFIYDYIYIYIVYMYHK